MPRESRAWGDACFMLGRSDGFDACYGHKGRSYCGLGAIFRVDVAGVSLRSN
jgi:hypothetical protein